MVDKTERIIHILIADDDPDDQFLIREALEEALENVTGLTLNLISVECGEDLLDFLYQKQQFSSEMPSPADLNPRPDLILLDLNMPNMTGAEVLKQIKADPLLKQIPIVILTTSKAQEDVFESYDLGASGFITKPVTYQALVEVMKSLEFYWIQTVELPPRDVSRYHKEMKS